jgi:hypothetical protein
MDVREACALVNEAGMLVRPGYSIEAEPYTQRFQSGVMLHIRFDAFDSSTIVDGVYTDEICVRSDRVILVGDCPGPFAVLAKVLNAVLDIEEHEWREFLRLGPDSDYMAPFHPHTDDGMHRWAHIGRLYVPTGSLENNSVRRDTVFGKI